MAIIPWVEVYKRKDGTDQDIEVIESYPFPDAIYDPSVPEYIAFTDLSTLRGWLDAIEDNYQRKSQLSRLSFIRDIWHPNHFMQVKFKEWKYKK
jgi:hypothetical protein